MSLFGTSPDAPAAASKSSLFDDESSAPAKSGSGLFADSSTDADDSPWGFTPKKQARASLVKTLLPANNVPDSYIDAFDALLEAGDRSGAGVSLAGVKKILSGTQLSTSEQERLLTIVLPGNRAAGMERGEFNVLLALVGLAQEGEEATLDGVDERRSRLPRPALPTHRQEASTNKSSNDVDSTGAQATNSTTKTQTTQKEQSVFFASDGDPWGSPGQSNRGAQYDSARANGNSNGIKSSTNHFITATTTDSSSGNAPSGQAGDQTQTGGGSDSWPGYNGVPGRDYSEPDLPGTGGFEDSAGGAGGGGSQGPSRPSRSMGGSAHVSRGIEEILTVTALPEKEGSFLFQYRNYEVSSNRRSSKVIRRYSDFVWLLDCLHKKFPFRQLPLLPPKRVAINGNHIAADALFIEKRRRGLARFVNTLVRHPVLNQEQLVTMFLTVPTELAVWRKQAAVTVQEEFIGKPLPPTLEDSLPPTLDSLFDTVRSGVRRSTEIYIHLCLQIERLVKRGEGLSIEHSRLSQSMMSLTEASADTYKMDTNDVPLMNEGLNSTARHNSTQTSLIEDESRAWELGILEDFKRQRDCLVSMGNMFDRRDRLARDNIPSLEKRIYANESKLSAVRAKPEATRKPNEAEKLEDAITKDKEAIVSQHARGVFIKECIRDEIGYFQSSQYHVSRLCQDWAAERVKFAELMADNWRTLSGEVETMPLGE